MRMQVNQTYEAIARSWAVSRKLQLLDICGQSIFPIYAADGGLAAKYIFYFRAPGQSLPNGLPLGLENEHHPSVWPIELSYDMPLDEAVEHVNERIEYEQLQAERNNALSAR